jgi:UDP-glucose 4-epimerase
MTGSRRILITGLSTLWGGRLAQMLERDERIEALVGIDTTDPRRALDRTEFVRVGSDEALLRRIIRAARIDTIVETRLCADALGSAAGRALDRELAAFAVTLSAAGGLGTPVRRLVVKSSAQVYGSGRDDPAFFTEEMSRTGSPHGPVEQALVTAELAIAAFSRDNPQVGITVLRCAPAIGADIDSPLLGLLGLPILPAMAGFDPRWQFIHEDDVLGALRHVVTHALPGIYNAAADGVLALSEVAALLGRPLVPLLPPWGSVSAATALRRLGLAVPVELLRDLRHGRGLDNRRLKAAGFAYAFTSREAVLELRAHQRLRPLLGAATDPYRYERAVEEFLRWSPNVQRLGAGDSDAGGPARRHGPPGPHGPGYGELTPDELLELIPSLESEAIRRLRDHEAAADGRPEVLEALDHQLAARGAVDGGGSD